MCLHKGRKMSPCLKFRHGIIARGIAQAQTSPGGFKMQGERDVARVRARVQNKLPQLALNFQNNSLCYLKQRKILLTVSILFGRIVEGDCFFFLLFPEETFTYVCFLNPRKVNKV